MDGWEVKDLYLEVTNTMYLLFFISCLVCGVSFIFIQRNERHVGPEE